jgi:transposase
VGSWPLDFPSARPPAKIVLRAAEGAQNKPIAEELGVQANTCALWRYRFHLSRLPGLEQDAPRSGGPLQISDATIRAIVHDTVQTKPSNATHGSTRTTAARFGVSPNTIHQIWRARRIQPHRLEHYKFSTDKHFEEKLRDVVGMYLNPPEHALVLRVDERTQLQTLCRTQSILPLQEGIPERQTHDHLRNGTTDLFAALDVLRGKIVGECHKRHRAKEFLAFLRFLDRITLSELDLHVVLDNLPTHRTARVKRWVLRHPSFHFHFVPTSSSWLNQVERWFKEITDKRVRRGTFHSEGELIEAVQLYIERYNEVPKPFLWRATGEQILAKIQKHRLNVDLTRTPY